ncbi:phospholipase D family protein [Luteimonas sp. R10]|uniref:phospholipase D family protein n=1 Tax=Luteimonas sp. R10 TaxID=3108176 RepID=UPI00308E2C22|nr:phospholipase D family protein [Luteimonas sp. R10]
MKKRLKRILAWGAFTLAALVVSGVLLADHLTPPATGAPGHALAVQRDQTALDRELMPLLDRNPGKTGAILLPDGLDAFAARALSARQAGRSLDLQYYIWHDDLTGHLLLHEAWQAAERGVRVRMLLDDINTSGKDTALLAMDQHPNVEIRVYNPFRNRDGLGRLLEMVQRSWSITHRMHNKAWIADGRVAVVGGRNIGMEYFDAAQDTNFRDLDLMLFGPAVNQASTIFDTFWNSDAVVPIAALSKRSERRLADVLAGIHQEARSAEARRFLDRVDASPSVRRYMAQELTPFWSERLRIVSDPPVKQDRGGREGWLIEHVMDDLRSARRKALLISPYFVPGSEGVAGLAELVRRHGVYVGVLTNSLAANDVLAVHSAYSKYRERLLRMGIRLHETRAQVSTGTSVFGSSGASLHTKAYVVDDRRGFIGSFNMDPRSIDLNTEMGVLFDEPAIARALRDEYLLLTSPELAWWVYLNADGDLRWLDASSSPPRVLTTEPDSTVLQRAMARALRWVPIESQL